MYVIAEVSFPDDDATYEVGAEVDCEPRHGQHSMSYEVGEPEVSAPDSALKLSRLVDTDTLPAGWSTIVEEALIEAFCDHCNDAADAAADYEYDRQREGDY